MVWDTDKELLDMIKDKDLSKAGKAHQYSQYVKELIDSDDPKEIEQHKALLNMFWQVCLDTHTAIDSEEISLAALYEVLKAIMRITLKGKLNEIKNQKKVNQLITSMTEKYKSILKDYKSVDAAVGYYANFSDDLSYAFFENLSLILSNISNTSEEDKKFAKKLLDIYSGVETFNEKKQVEKKEKEKKIDEISEVTPPKNPPSPTESEQEKQQQIQDETTPDPESAKQDEDVDEEDVAEAKSGPSAAPSKKKRKEKKRKSPTKKEELKVNALVNELIKLAPTQNTLDNKNFEAFFLSLCKAIRKQMPYQEYSAADEDLVIHDKNFSTLENIIKEANTYVNENQFQDKVLLFLLLDKFHKTCLSTKNNPRFILDVNKIAENFKDANEQWHLRNRSEKMKLHYFHSLFDKEYLNQLNEEHRYEVAQKFRAATAYFVGNVHRTALITFCANQLWPENKPEPAKLTPVNGKSNTYLNYLEVKIIPVIQNALSDSKDILDITISLLEQFKNDYKTIQQRKDAELGILVQFRKTTNTIKNSKVIETVNNLLEMVKLDTEIIVSTTNKLVKSIDSKDIFDFDKTLVMFNNMREILKNDVFEESDLSFDEQIIKPTNRSRVNEILDVALSMTQSGAPEFVAFSVFKERIMPGFINLLYPIFKSYTKIEQKDHAIVRLQVRAAYKQIRDAHKDKPDICMTRIMAFICETLEYIIHKPMQDRAILQGILISEYISILNQKITCQDLIGYYKIPCKEEDLALFMLFESHYAMHENNPNAILEGTEKLLKGLSTEEIVTIIYRLRFYVSSILCKIENDEDNKFKSSINGLMTFYYFLVAVEYKHTQKIYPFIDIIIELLKKNTLQNKDKWENLIDDLSETDLFSDNIQPTIKWLTFANANSSFINVCLLNPPLIKLKDEDHDIIRQNADLIKEFLIKVSHVMLTSAATQTPSVSTYALANGNVSSSSHSVPPGTENPAWCKFYYKVYGIFAPNSKNTWDATLDEESKKTILKPFIEKFIQDFPDENEDKKALRHFTSFIASDDCLFAEGAKDYAWLFLKMTMPDSVDILDNLKASIDVSRQQNDGLTF